MFDLISVLFTHQLEFDLKASPFLKVNFLIKKKFLIFDAITSVTKNKKIQTK